MNKNEKRPPELLCIGLLCHDLYQGRNLLGGTASYSSIMASHLGLSTAVLTSVGADFEFNAVFDQYQIEVHNILAPQTTVFENTYQNGERRQYLHARAHTLFPKHLPLAWQQIPIVKFCLIADEADPSFLPFFPHALIAATIQGWLRQWDAQGRVSSKPMNWELLRHVDIVFMSNDDIAGYEAALPRIIELVPIVVMTKGKEGATIWQAGRLFDFPAFPTQEVDPTGAGDIFAASFLVKYRQSGHIEQAAAFAHSAASYIVEDYGIKIPSIEAIEDRCALYLKHWLNY
ncbi:MAG: PfkB family carbohydrate kinase [Bacteroidota bacterium]